MHRSSGDTSNFEFPRFDERFPRFSIFSNLDVVKYQCFTFPTEPFSDYKYITIICAAT